MRAVVPLVQVAAPPERLTIITGRGKHSQDGPKIKPAVQDYLRSSLLTPI